MSRNRLRLCACLVTCLLPLVIAQITPTLSARVVRTKLGSVKGVLVIPSNRDLQPVEAFLGLPYAAPPVGALRFMPPVSPLPWNGVRLMDKFAPACPQTLPDVNNEREALRHVSRGRLQYLRRLLPYLRNQSEDCLYLNIYAPVVVGGKDSNIKFPVIVFIHGESYEWNSGNPYDGSILASYGDVVVVTLNFRLGVLGFLRPDLKENRIANFGLLDQIAALQWIQENIGEFGGDRDSVTLMGHGTGASCVNLLLISPVAQASPGLFHRAILMSGTALADWATVDNPIRYTLQAAQQVDCPVTERDDELAACLRSKRVTELMNVRLQAPLFASPLAPVVDGVVVPNEPRLSMKTYNDLFGRYDVMYGVTQSESFHLLNAARLQLGLTEAERNGFVRTYVRNSFSTNIDQVTAAILNAYTDWKDPIRDTNEYRDSLLDILSDARVVAPVVHMGDLHSAIRQRSYFYVFAHQTTAGDYPQHWGSVHGEELPYVFGMPLVGGTNHMSMNYTRAEMLLSEIVITYWANFARTGQKFLTSNPRDRFEPSYVQWPAYDRHSQKYLNIELRPKVKDHYRADKMALWSKLIPELLSGVNGKDLGEEDDEDEEDEDEKSSQEVSNESPTEANQGVNTAGIPVFTPISGTENSSDVSIPVGEQSGIALSIVIVIGICVFVVNVCVCAGLFYQRDRARFKEMLVQRQYKLRPASCSTELKPTSKADKSKKKPDRVSSKLDEEFELEEMPSTLLHQESTSTIDPHTKCSQWIAQEMNADDQSPTPPHSHHLRPNRPDVTKLGGSDRYDPSALRFPQLSKTVAASDICELVSTEHQIRPALKKSPEKATSRTSTGRRKTRTRSRTNSILKRDVAVGGDDDFPSDAAAFEPSQENAAMDTIRRLNLPKVLPDLPHQDVSIPAELNAKVGFDESADRPVLGNESPHHGALIVKSNFPHTLVLAPHPRTGLSTTKAPSSSASAEPEPCLIVRPGQRVAHQQPLESESVRRAQTESGTSRPTSRNSRSWYAQYSQSFISQSIDHDEQQDAG